MKKSQRLQKIDEMVTQKYDHIWDCCCDHGLLGMSLLERRVTGVVHFVDVVETLILGLTESLKTYADGLQWQTHCIDVAQLPLSKNESHLIIIAGVGGDLLIDLVGSITNKYPELNLEFILCPVHHNYQVREALINLNYSLVNESLVKENKRFYEIIHVVRHGNQSLSLTGSEMWDFKRVEDREYLQLILAHYERMGNNPSLNVQPILTAYRKLNS